MVSMLGEDVNWVRNLRAADGHAVLQHGRTEAVRLEEVDVPDRAPILRRYVQVAPGARPHIPAGPQAPLAYFERISPDFPVFRIRADAALPAAHRRAMLPNRHCRHGSGSERDARVDG